MKYGYVSCMLGGLPLPQTSIMSFIIGVFLLGLDRVFAQGKEIKCLLILLLVFTLTKEVPVCKSISLLVLILGLIDSADQDKGR